MTEQIVRNSMITPDGTELISHFVHDYVTYQDKNGEEYIVDGGTSYIRRSVNKEPAQDTLVYLSDGHEKVREAFEWGIYGKDGQQPFKRIKLKDMASDHIKSCLELYPDNFLLDSTMGEELKYRTLKIKTIS